MARTRRFSWPLAVGTIGVVGVVLPSAVLELVAPTGWEVEMLRFLGVLAAVVASLWPWARNQGGRSAQRMRRWTTASTGILAVYVLSAESLFLVVAFCLLIGALLDVGVERADLASKRLMESLDRRATRASGD
ncbi:MAG: hypothetical protein WB245_12975 [Acidimicrobiia bacterium]